METRKYAMIIRPTKEEEFENQQWQLSYIHFAMRLQERYHMKISFSEYKELCKTPIIQTIKKQTQNKSIALIKFRNTYIVAGVGRNSLLSAAKIRTALPLKKKHKQIIQNLKQS
jgi:hypothetical protein